MIEATCQQCGKVFAVKPYKLAQGKGKFCSRDCCVAPAEERFHQRIKKDPVTGCWIWIAARGGHGYGNIKINRNATYAHRLAWTLFKGPIPDEMNVLHRCDVPACCNPEHLFIGTDSDNAQDMVAKGRNKNPLGESHWNAKLSHTDILNIRGRHAAGESSLRLATWYGITKESINNIIARRTWKHIA